MSFKQYFSDRGEKKMKILQSQNNNKNIELQIVGYF